MINPWMAYRGRILKATVFINEWEIKQRGESKVERLNDGLIRVEFNFKICHISGKRITVFANPFPLRNSASFKTSVDETVNFIILIKEHLRKSLSLLFRQHVKKCQYHSLKTRLQMFSLLNSGQIYHFYLRIK